MKALGYLNRRFSPRIQVPALAGMFLSIQLFLGLAAGDLRLDWRAVPMGLAFVLLFLQIRIVDDIDDHDGTTEPSRQRLMSWLAVTLLLVVVCSVAWPPAICTALAASAASTAPFLTARLRAAGPRSTGAPTSKHFRSTVAQAGHLRATRPVVLVVHEASPLLVTSYGYAAWRVQSDQSLSNAAGAATLALFWISYEVWKWSRELDRGPGRPHGFSSWSLRCGLVAILAAAAGCVLVVLLSSQLPTLFAVYAVALPLAMAGRLITQPGPVGWRGLVFPLGLQLGVIVSAVVVA